MAPTDLPDVAALRDRIGALLGAAQPFGVVATRVGGGADALVDGPACAVVLERLGAVVRGSDLLAFVPPCTFVLVSDELGAIGVPHLEERLRDAVGLPVTIDDRAVAFPAHQSSVLVEASSGAVVVDRRSPEVPVLVAPASPDAVLDAVLGPLP